MPFLLRRLPFLAINEVIKSMDTREIFFLSMLSKKSANLVMLSIPKNSLSAELMFKKDGFLFELMPKGFMKQGANFFPVATYGFTRFSTCGLYVQCNWTYTFKVEESSWKLFYCFSKIFKNSKFSITFDCSTREEFAMAIMRFAWGNDILLDRINFYLDKTSPESIQELLNGCNNQHTFLHIGTEIPKDFKCTPPPGQIMHDFLQCQQLVFWGGVSGLTNEYLNGLLKKIVNLECRIKDFALKLWNEPSDFAQIVRGLSDSAIQQNGDQQELHFERKDGLKLMISLSNGYLDLENDVL